MTDARHVIWDGGAKSDEFMKREEEATSKLGFREREMEAGASLDSHRPSISTPTLTLFSQRHSTYVLELEPGGRSRVGTHQLTLPRIVKVLPCAVTDTS